MGWENSGDGLLVSGEIPGAQNQAQTFTNGIIATPIYGGTAANDDISISGTSHATKTTSYVLLQPSGGNVGIGTTAPNSRLEVVNTSAGAETLPARITNAQSTNNTAAGIVFNISSASVDNAKIVAIRLNSPSAADTALAFSTVGNAGLAERVRISPTGNVGIGTTAPGCTLHVYRGTSGKVAPYYANAGFILENSNQVFAQVLVPSGVSASSGFLIATELNDALSGIVYNPVTAVTTVKSGGGNIINISGAGYVGIQTTSPDSLLHASVSTANTNTVQQLLTLSANSTGTAAAGFGSRILWELKSSTTDDQTAAALDVIWTDATHATRTSYMAFSTVNSGTLAEHFRLSGAGDFGFGTTPSATSKITVYKVYNASTTQTLANFTVQVQPTSDGTAQTRGVQLVASKLGNFNHGSIRGGVFIAAVQGGAGVLNTAIGGVFSIEANSTSNATMTNAYGIQIASPTKDGGTATITTINGIRVENQGAAHVGNAYGLYLDAQSGASTLNYAIYSAGGLSYHAGTMQFGNSAQVGGTAARGTTAGTNRIDLFNGTAPVGTLTNGVSLYSVAGELWAMDAAGDANQLTGKYERHVQLDAKANGTVANQPAQVDFFTAGGLQFATTGAKYAFCQWEIPDDWDGTDVVFEIDWFPDSGATSGTDAVRWTVEYRAIAEGELINNGTSVTLDNGVGGDTADYSQYQTKHSRFTLTYNNANQPLTAQDHVYFKISRDTGVANDFGGTVTATAYEVIYQSKGFPTSN